MFLDEFNLFFQENQVAYVEELCGSSRATPLLAQHGPLWFWRAGNDFQNLPATFVSSIVYSLYMSIYNEETFEKYLWIYVYVFSLLFSDCFFFKTITVFSWHVTHVYVFFVHGFLLVWLYHSKDDCSGQHSMVFQGVETYFSARRLHLSSSGFQPARAQQWPLACDYVASPRWHHHLTTSRPEKSWGSSWTDGLQLVMVFLNVYGIARPFRAFSF